MPPPLQLRNYRKAMLIASEGHPFVALLHPMPIPVEKSDRNSFPGAFDSQVEVPYRFLMKYTDKQRFEGF